MNKEKGGKFVTFILIFLILTIIACVGILGFNIFKQFDVEEVVSEAQNIIEEVQEQVKLENLVSTPEIVENPIDQVESLEEPEEIQYTNQSSGSTFFYDQLDENARIIYNGIENNKENMKTGTYTVNFGSSFSGLLSESNGQELLGDAYQSAIEAFAYDHPEVFYLNPNKMYLNIQKETRGSQVTYKVFINNGKATHYLADGFSSKEQIDSAEAQLQNIRNQVISQISGTNYEKAKQVHNTLVNHITYDTSISKSNIYDIYGALIKKESVCEGYSKSYKYLLDALGIPCVIVAGEATNSQGQTENHSWNYIQMGSAWYAVDVTWDDPVITGGGSLTNNLRYKYFLKGINSINQDHVPNGQFTPGGKVFTYPNLSSQDYE